MLASGDYTAVNSDLTFLPSSFTPGISQPQTLERIVPVDTREDSETEGMEQFEATLQALSISTNIRNGIATVNIEGTTICPKPHPLFIASLGKKGGILKEF